MDIEHNWAYISHLTNCLESLNVPECMSENFMCNMCMLVLNMLINSYYSCIVQSISEYCELFLAKHCIYKDTDVRVKNEVVGWHGNGKVHHAAVRRSYKLWNSCSRPRNGREWVFLD